MAASLELSVFSDVSDTGALRISGRVLVCSRGTSLVYRGVRNRLKICCEKCSVLRITLGVDLSLKQCELLLDRFAEIKRGWDE